MHLFVVCSSSFIATRSRVSVTNARFRAALRRRCAECIKSASGVELFPSFSLSIIKCFFFGIALCLHPRALIQKRFEALIHKTTMELFAFCMNHHKTHWNLFKRLWFNGERKHNYLQRVTLCRRLEWKIHWDYFLIMRSIKSGFKTLKRRQIREMTNLRDEFSAADVQIWLISVLSFATGFYTQQKRWQVLKDFKIFWKDWNLLETHWESLAKIFLTPSELLASSSSYFLWAFHKYFSSGKCFETSLKLTSVLNIKIGV